MQILWLCPLEGFPKTGINLKTGLYVGVCLRAYTQKYKWHYVYMYSKTKMTYHRDWFKKEVKPIKGEIVNTPALKNHASKLQL